MRGGKIYTPHTATILEGITRDALITLAKDQGFEVIEAPISRDQIYIADEVFVCGTAAEVVPVTEVDFRKIGNGKIGPVTAVLQKTFNAVIRGEGPHAAEWLDLVGEYVITSYSIHYTKLYESDNTPGCLRSDRWSVPRQPCSA